MKTKVNVEGGELVLRNEHGDTVIIPRERRKEAMKALLKDDHRAIDSLALQLPKASRYAAKGTVLGGQDPGNGLTRPDGTKKGKGFYGNLPNKNGNISSELSISSSDVEEGKEVLIPTLIPGLSRKEIDYLLSNKYNPQSRVGIDNIISRKAIDFARKRKQQGFPYFAHEIEEGAFKYASGGNIKPDPSVEGIMGPETTITAPRPEKSIGNFFKRWGYENSKGGSESLLGAIGSGIGAALQLPQAAVTYMLDPKGNVKPGKALTENGFNSTSIMKNIGKYAATHNDLSGTLAKLVGTEEGQNVLLDPLLASNEINKGVTKGLELINGLGKEAVIIGDKLGAKYLPNAYKFNPYAFKPNPKAYYHRSPNLENIINKETGNLQGFGQSDAGKLFNETAGPRPGMGINLKKPANNRLFYSKGTPLDYGRYNPSGQGYEGPFMIELSDIPMLSASQGKTKAFAPTNLEAYAVTSRPVNINEANFYKEDWLRGYKQVEVPKSNFKSEIDWSKWNKEIPENKKLIQEYNLIEQQAKANGTWMKNPDGSTFKGTPEQFVQQNSQNFKKSFPNVLKDRNDNIQVNYHVSDAVFDSFNENKFKHGTFGKGIYTTPNRNFGSNPYELYINSNNPQNKFFPQDFGKNRKEYFELQNKLSGASDVEKEEIFKKMYALDDKHKSMIKAENELRREGDYLREGYDSYSPDYTREWVIPFSNNPKSAIGNNGMFDMTNPNIYKALAPTIIAGALANKNKN